MAPTCPEEVDVFTIPHSRMKELVQKYLDMLTATNFSDVLHLTTLLETLSNMFGEFKAHEQIENQFIMKKLKDKLRALSIENTAVCNCHSDNRLSDMMNLLKDGYKCTKKTEAERKNYGIQLQSALEEFTKTFIPHMEEEEEVFQPLLMKYFTFDELRDIKINVLQHHCLRGDETTVQEEKFVEDYVTCESTDEDCKDSHLSPISSLPDEVILRIFGHLSPRDLCRCARVSSRWNSLAMDGSLWGSLCPVQWAKGKWSFDVETNMEEEEEGVHVMERILSRVKLDEDADIDESEESDSSDSGDIEVRQVRYEADMLAGIVKHLLPRVGSAVRKCNLAYSKGITNGVLYKILSQCPNLDYLILTQTRISDVGFKGLARADFQSQLKHVELSGCVGVTDVTLQRLSSALSNSRSHKYEKNVKDSEKSAANSANKNRGCLKAAKEISQSRTKYAGKSCERRIKIAEKMSFSKTCAGVKTPVGGKCCRNVSCDSGKCNDGKLPTPSSDLTCSNLVIGCQQGLLGCDWLNCCHMVQDTIVSNVCDTDIDSEPRTLVCDAEERSDLNNGDEDLTFNIIPGESLNERTFKPSVGESVEKLDNTKTCARGLEYLSLSGCYRITDQGLSSLAADGGLPNLLFLDISGCMNITKVGLCALVETCSHLNQSHLFYCDNIVDGPFADGANGCQNLQSTSRVCCRSGE